MENTQTFNFELVSPERKLVSKPARMVVVPGEEGDFGVLPNHAATIASVRPGVILVFAGESEEPQKIFVGGGFADVTETHCTVLAEDAVDVRDLSRDDLEQTIRNLTEDLGMADGEADKGRVEKKLLLAKAKLSAVTGQVVV